MWRLGIRGWGVVDDLESKRTSSLVKALWGPLHRQHAPPFVLYHSEVCLLSLSEVTQPGVGLPTSQ